MSKKPQVNDILAASDIDYIDTLENENAKLRSHIKGLANNIAEMSGLIRKEQDRAEKAETEVSDLELENGLLETELASFKEELVSRYSDISHLNTEIASLNEQLSHMRMMLDEAEASNYHEKLREAIQSERKRWAKEDAEALRVRDIEQQIKGVQIVLDCPELNLSQGEVDTLKLIKEQLRKELEK